MTVKELIEQLKQMPENAKVGYYNGDYSIYDPEIITECFYDEHKRVVTIGGDY